jgi:hypothetical protein
MHDELVPVLRILERAPGLDHGCIRRLEARARLVEIRGGRRALRHALAHPRDDAAMHLEIRLREAQQLALPQHLDMRLDGVQRDDLGGLADAARRALAARLLAFDLAVRLPAVEQALRDEDAGLAARERAVAVAARARGVVVGPFRPDAGAQIDLRQILAARARELLLDRLTVARDHIDAGVGLDRLLRGLAKALRRRRSRESERRREGDDKRKRVQAALQRRSHGGWDPLVESGG